MNLTRLKLAATGVILLSLLSVGHSQAQETPKSTPEQKQLEKLVGTWKYQGDVKATPLGPAEKFAGTMQNKLTLNGFLLQGTWTEPDTNGLELHAYDAALKRIHYHSFDTTGTIIDGFETVNGNSCHGDYTSTDAKGRTYKARSTMEFSQDAGSFTVKWEISQDAGKTWVPFVDVKFEKQKN